jgi:hypothetical protein
MTVSLAETPHSARTTRVIRVVNLFEWKTARGYLIRSDPFRPSLDRIKLDLNRVFIQVGTDAEERAAGMTLCLEAVSNWWRHNSEGDLYYKVSARPGTAAAPACIEQVYHYPSKPFNTHTTLPDDPENGGMGIVVMRGLCCPRDENGHIPRNHPNIRFEFGRNMLTLRLLRYPTEE